MQKNNFDYPLPEGHIAHAPSEPRDAARLLALDRQTGTITHTTFAHILSMLTANDILVFNETKVFPARLFGKKETGGTVEVLLLREVTPSVWEVLGKNIPKAQGTIIFDEMKAQVLEKSDDRVVISFNASPLKLREVIQKSGQTPLPPYIHSKDSEDAIRAKYQTVFAKHEGSVAAPTAGLHFTHDLLSKIKAQGIQMEYVTLHVGAGTFLPIKETNIVNHHMHSEYFSIDPTTIAALNEAKLAGRRIIAVGTTTTRVLETIATREGLLSSGRVSGETNIFIYPPYQFKFVDALITNFHLPHSTLMALVSAFVSTPNTKHEFSSFKESVVGRAYAEAIAQNYRFYSFGDGMMIG